MARVLTTSHGKQCTAPNQCPHRVLCFIRAETAFALPHMPDDSMQLRSSLVLWRLFSQQVSSTSVPDEVHLEAPSIVLQQLAYM